MKNHFQMPVSCHVLLRREGEILMLLRQGTGYEDGKYSLVAGHLDGNETATQAMIREAFEEVGVVIRHEDMKFACVMHRMADKEYIDFFFVCDTWDGEIENKEPHKCGGLIFVPGSHLPENTIPYIRAGVEATQKGEAFVMIGWKKIP